MASICLVREGLPICLAVANERDQQMETELLRTFMAVVDTGSFTRAARQVCRTQAAVSQQMKRLEQQLDKTLFIREGRSLQLTAEGKSLVGYARRILLLHDEAFKQLANGPEAKPLRLGCPDDYMHTVIPYLMKLIHRVHPELEVQVFGGSTNQLRPRLDAGELDLSVMTRPTEHDEGYVLFQDQGVWVLPDQIDLNQEAPLPLALSEPDCKFNSTVVDGLEKQGRSFQVKVVANNTALLAELVRRNGMVSAMVSSSVPEGVKTRPGGGDMPDLPSVAIVIAHAAIPHPNLGLQQLQQICSAFYQDYYAGKTALSEKGQN